MKSPRNGRRVHESRNEATHLEPLDDAEGTAGENPFHRSEAHNALHKTVLPAHPLYCTRGLLTHRKKRLNGVEDAIPLCWVAYVLLDTMLAQMITY